MLKSKRVKINLSEVHSAKKDARTVYKTILGDRTYESPWYERVAIDLKYVGTIHLNIVY